MALDPGEPPDPPRPPVDPPTETGWEPGEDKGPSPELAPVEAGGKHCGGAECRPDAAALEMKPAEISVPDPTASPVESVRRSTVRRV